MRIQALLILMLAWPPFIKAAAAPDVILERARQMLLRGEAPAVDAANRYLESQRPDGSWPDIDYSDRSRSQWRPLTHLSRIQALIRVLKQDSRFMPAIERGLDYWIEVRPQSGNWWYNEIGTPRAMRDIIILLGDRLRDERLDGCMEVLAQRRMRATGANLMWSAELALHHGAVLASRYGSPRREEGLAELAEAARRIHGEIQVGWAEGIQDDYSFYQHGARLQSFHYGHSYLDVAVKLGWQLRESPWEYPEEKAEIITNYILEGLRWMSRGRYTVPSTLDRAVSRPGSMSVDLQGLLGLWHEVTTIRAQEIEALAAGESGEGPALTGFRHFPHADFSTYHRPSFSFFLKGISTRILLTEDINSENQLGKRYLQTGDHYLLRHGDEYHDLQPVWDWPGLPGLTTSDDSPEIDKQGFVGGLGDGQRGMGVFDLARTGGAGRHSFGIRRLCAMNADAVVCLLSEARIEGSAGSIRTSLEQNRLRGPVWISEDGRQRAEVPDNKDVVQTARWIWHDNVGYLLNRTLRMRVRAGKREGNWRRINRALSDETIASEVFLAEVLHDRPSQSFTYAILPGVSLDGISATAESPAWQVLTNSRSQQAVRFGDGTVFAAMYEPGALEVEGQTLLQTDHSCLAMWDASTLWMADPNNAGFTIQARWGGELHTVRLPAGGRGTQIRRYPE